MRKIIVTCFLMIMMISTSLIVSADEGPTGFIGIGLNSYHSESEYIGTPYYDNGDIMVPGSILDVSCSIYLDSAGDYSYDTYLDTKVTDGIEDPDIYPGSVSLGAISNDITFIGLDEGEYRIVCEDLPNAINMNYYGEYTPPTGWEYGDDYFLDNNVVMDSGEYSGGGSMPFLSFAYQDLNIQKLDSQTGEPIEGAVFELYQDSNQDGNYDSYINSYTTDSNGLIELDNIVTGSYQLVETNAAPGYINNGETYEFNSDYNEAQSDFVYGDEDSPYVIENDPMVGYIELSKVGVFEDNKYFLEDVSFDVYADVNENGLIDDNDQIVDTMITDENGNATSKGLTKGNYLVVESEVPDGVIIDQDSVYTATIDATNDIYYLNNNQSIENQLLDTDGDKVVDIVDLCSSTLESVEVDENGCEVQSNETTDVKEETETQIDEDVVETDKNIADTGFSTQSFLVLAIIVIIIIVVVIKMKTKK